MMLLPSLPASTWAARDATRTKVRPTSVLPAHRAGDVASPRPTGPSPALRQLARARPHLPSGSTRRRAVAPTPSIFCRTSRMAPHFPQGPRAAQLQKSAQRTRTCARWSSLSRCGLRVLRDWNVYARKAFPQPPRAFQPPSNAAEDALGRILTCWQEPQSRPGSARSIQRRFPGWRPWRRSCASAQSSN